jgi:hypothetical protein
LQAPEAAAECDEEADALEGASDTHRATAPTATSALPSDADIGVHFSISIVSDL